MQYFDHDTNASSDPKIIELRITCGGAAVDAYWYFLERMYMDEDSICICNGNANAMRVHAHCLCIDVDTLCEWVQSMINIGLLRADEDDPNKLTSDRVKANIAQYHEKAEKRRSAANKRWGKDGDDASGMQVQSKSNAKKRKENKRKESSAIKSTTTLSGVGAAVEKSTPPPSKKHPRCKHCRELVSAKSDGSGLFFCTEHGELNLGEVFFT